MHNSKQNVSVFCCAKFQCIQRLKDYFIFELFLNYNCRNFEYFSKFPIDWIICILISFCVLFLCFVTVRQYPFNYEILDYRRIFEAIKISGLLTLYLIISIVLFNKREKNLIPSLIRYFCLYFILFYLHTAAITLIFNNINNYLQKIQIIKGTLKDPYIPALFF